MSEFRVLRVWGFHTWGSDIPAVGSIGNHVLLLQMASLLGTAPWFTRESSSLCYLLLLLEWPQIRAHVPMIIVVAYGFLELGTTKATGFLLLVFFRSFNREKIGKPRRKLHIYIHHPICWKIQRIYQTHLKILKCQLRKSILYRSNTS